MKVLWTIIIQFNSIFNLYSNQAKAHTQTDIHTDTIYTHAQYTVKEETKKL